MKRITLMWIVLTGGLFAPAAGFAQISCSREGLQRAVDLYIAAQTKGDTSGMPLAIAQTTNNNAFAGFGTQRPNLVGDPELPSDERSVSRWFNTSAFTAAPAFTIGTSSRNPVRGPSYRNLDLALMRRVPLSGARALELRAEVFNATNTPLFLAPNTTVGAAAFGTITAAGDPRVIQLALKFLF